MSTKKAITTKDAPAAIGPYSPATRAGQLVFLSGQIALDPGTGQLIAGDVKAQTRLSMENVKALLAASGCTFADVVKTTIYLVDLNDFAAVNEVYASYLPEPYPARSTVQVAALPRGARVEIDVTAVASG